MGLLDQFSQTILPAWDLVWGNKVTCASPPLPSPIRIVDDFIWVDEEILSPEEAQERKKTTDALSHFSLIETLAHTRTGAYGAYRRGQQTEVKIQDGPEKSLQTYNIVPIKTKSAGLVAEIFTPKDKTQSQVYINWTGTYNLATVIADLETAPGEESYRSDEFNILQQINKVVKQVSDNSGKKVQVTITGHSLGGSLAQLNTHSLQRAIATNVYEQALDQGDHESCAQWIKAEKVFRYNQQQNIDQPGQDIPLSCRTHLTGDYIDSITMGTWNAAGVLKTITQNSEGLTPLIRQTGIKQKAYISMVGGDAVQTTGQDNLFSHADPEDVDIHLIKMDIDLETGLSRGLSMSSLAQTAMTAGTLLLGVPGLIFGGLYIAYTRAKAHTSKHFVSPQSHPKFELFNNQTPEGRKVIQDKLTNKSSILQWSPLRAVQRGLHTVATSAYEYVMNSPYTKTTEKIKIGA